MATYKISELPEATGLWENDKVLVAQSGDSKSATFSTLKDSLNIPAEQVNSDWTATEGKAQILNKPRIVSPKDAALSSDIAGAQATADFVNSSINAFAAYYVTKNADGEAFETFAELSTATTFYNAGEERIPTKNDYCIVRADETHKTEAGVSPTTRYTFSGEAYPDGQWEFQYVVNDTTLTSAQLAAINSGITSGLIADVYDAIATIPRMDDTVTEESTHGVKSSGIYAFVQDGLAQKQDNLSEAQLANIADVTNKAYLSAAVELKTDSTGQRTALTIGTRGGDVGKWSVVTGSVCQAAANYSQAGGIKAAVLSADTCAYAWQGVNGDVYNSKGAGTYAINPADPTGKNDPTNGFFIGQKSFDTLVNEKAKLLLESQLSALDPLYSSVGEVITALQALYQ